MVVPSLASLAFRAGPLLLLLLGVPDASAEGSANESLLDEAARTEQDISGQAEDTSGGLTEAAEEFTDDALCGRPFFIFDCPPLDFQGPKVERDCLCLP